jgi:hypothetical protein
LVRTAASRQFADLGVSGPEERIAVTLPRGGAGAGLGASSRPWERPKNGQIITFNQEEVAV